MEMTILERGDGISHVALAGRLDTNAAEQLDKQFSEAIGAQSRSAIVDLSQVDFMASRGIGLLIANGKRLRKAGHKLVLLDPQPIVAGVLKTSKADLLMLVVQGIEEAVRAAGGRAGDVVATAGREAAAVKSPEPSAPEASAPVAALDTLKLTIQNEMSELDVLNAAVAGYLTAHAAPARAAYAVNLATEELLTNVIRYAYMDDETHLIDVQLRIEADQLVLTLIDDGMPFDPRKHPALNVHAEDYEGGGMGLLLVLDMVDVLKYRREAERNRVEVRIHLADEAEVEDAPAAPGEASQ